MSNAPRFSGSLPSLLPRWDLGLTRLKIAALTREVTAPHSAADDLYDALPNLTPEQVQLSPLGLHPGQVADVRLRLQHHLAEQAKKFAGFQINLDFTCAESIAPFLDSSLNNAGDPYESRAYSLNSKILERAVLDHFAALWNAPWPHDPNAPDTYWGYILAMGSTEGNLHGLWSARDYLSGAPLFNDAVPPPPSVTSPPVLLYCEEAHYSIVKAARILNLDTPATLGNRLYPGENPLAPERPWPACVPARGGPSGDGDIDVEALTTLAQFFAARGHPLIVALTCGTTFKGAHDDVPAVDAALTAAYRGRPHPPHSRRPYWIHVDGALAATTAPFQRMAAEARLLPSAPPPFDFRVPGVCSLTTSAHKWLGTPWECGIYMTRTGLRPHPPASAEYVGAPDTTLSGSRNGFSALIMWERLAGHSYDDHIRTIVRCDHVADYALHQLRELQSTLGIDLWPSRTPHSLAIRFRAPAQHLAHRYSLSCETHTIDGTARTSAHLYAMPHLTTETVDLLIHDLRHPHAFEGDFT
ncbi:pyridoxal-dependent decarboxylase [Streptomyces sp. NPDC052036]|uniref:pyridoxal-dependent decarboxylase n=1 Tax=unclassified Streptomyces TaxID=2593676 RepID=UPI0034381AA1